MKASLPALILPSRAVAAGLDARVTAFVAGYVLVLSLLAPVLATHAERIARPFGRRPSDVVPTGGVR
jgi:monovalent cation:H+ antiporter-2, CPA2 family